MALRFVLAFLLMLGTATAQTFNLLHEFTDVPDGAFPSALTWDAAGNLYGATGGGGTVCDDYGNGCGTVFELGANGVESVLYRFSGAADGGHPAAGVIRDSAGNLYGTTGTGGTHGAGTVFKLDPAGQETVLHSFDLAHGAYPESGLVRDPDGNLYGVTPAGSGAYKYGTVFEVSLAGKTTVLHRFTGGSDGGYPFGSLVLDSKGNLYGSTAAGYGTIFKLTHSGTKSVLHRFTSFGVRPYDGLIRGADGDFYGTTYQGGGSNGCNNDDRGCGTLFKLTETGKFTVLYTFTGGRGGGLPVGNLTEDASGNLYGIGWNDEGTECQGGPCGMLFEFIRANGKEAALVSFGTEGADSSGGLLLDANGNFYGTGGGGLDCDYGCGVIFKLAP